MEADRERFDELFVEHVRALHRFVVRRVGSAAVDDVVSDTFLIAWRRLAEVPAGEAARSWLFSTARWVVANHLRSARRRSQLADRVGRQPGSPSADPGEVVSDAALVRVVLASLTSGDQEVLRLAEWDDLPAADCARLLGCSVGTFQVRLHRARRRFAAALDATGTASFDDVRQVTS